MNTEEYSVSRYDGAVLLLPYSIRDRARELTRGRRALCEEFRLRVGQPPSVVMPEGETSLGGDKVTRKDIEFVIELASGASQHHVRDKLRMGYITAKGGYRIGICGAVNMLEGKPAGFSGYSSVNIRISRQITGISAQLLMKPEFAGTFPSVLIVSPPGGGKTTLLRDMVRQLSDGRDGRGGWRVGLCDERSEIAAFCDGEAQMDVGRRTDILDGCPKAEGIIMLLRSMNPQIIAIDEITSADDLRAVVTASHCGISLLATAHADGVGDLQTRPLYRELLQAGVFRYAVSIEKTGGTRIYTLIKL